MRKPVFNVFMTRTDTNRAVQPQKMVRGLKLCIKKEEGLYYLCSKNEEADHPHVHLICTFVFRICKKISYNATDLLLN